MKGIISSMERVEHLRRLFLSVETKMENCWITELLTTLPIFQKLNWDQMSAHTVNMILLVNVSLNETHDDKNGSLVDFSQWKKILDKLKNMPWTSNFRSRD